MSLEQVIADHTIALNALTAAITANTAKMTELTGTPANVVPITKPAPAPAPKEKAKPSAKETPAPEPVVEETPEPEAPVEETPAPAAEEGEPEYLSWDDATLKLAINEYCKTRITSPNSTAFKEAFNAELARLGVDKAAKLAPEQRAAFYGKALTW